MNNTEEKKTNSISDWLKVKKAPDGFNQPAKTNQGNTSANPASNPYGTITETNAYTDLANGGQSAASAAPAPASVPAATPNNIYSGAFDKVKTMNQNSADAYKKSIYAGADASATRLSGQKRNIYQQFEENKKAAEQAQRQALKELPVNMSGLGLYGQGIGETAISNIRNSYAQQLTELMKQRDNNLYDIDNQVEALRQQAEADIYNYEAQLMAQNPQYYLQLLQAENDENWRNTEWNYGIERDKKSDERNARHDEAEWFGTVDGKPTFASNVYSDEKAMQEKQYADSDTQGAAEFIVQFGYLPETLYPNSRLTEEEKNNLVNIYKQNLYKSSSGSSGGGGSSSSVTKYQNMIDADSKISKEIYSINGFFDTGLYDSGITENSVKNQLACAFKKVYNDGYAIKQYLVSNGYTQSGAENKLEEYQNNVLRKMAENGMITKQFDSNGKYDEEKTFSEAKKKYL